MAPGLAERMGGGAGGGGRAVVGVAHKLWMETADSDSLLQMENTFLK